MIKGKSTIQLFDGNTGREVYRAQDENMVTNAVENLLNPPGEWVFSGADFREVYKNVTPIYSRALGGIMLWKDNLPESAEQILPPPNAVEVAHAGGAYTGTDTSRGSYNATESGKIENGYRHVWDFGTDRGNCTFSAVTLTSLAGGRTGWSYHKDMSPFYDSHYRFNNSDSSMQYITGLEAVAGVGSAYRFLGRFRKNVYTFIRYESGTPIITDVETQNPSKLGVLTNLSSYTAQNKFTDTKLSSALCSNINISFVTEDGRIMLSKSSGGTMTVSFIDPVSKEVTEQKTFSGNFTDSYTAAYFGGKYYLTKNTGSASKLVAIDDDGSETDTGITSPSGYAYVLGGRLYVPVNNSVKATANGTDFVQLLPPVISGSAGIVYDYDRKLPYVLYSYNGSAMIIRNYLATINNLSAAVTKTDQQTMKITYEIYQTAP